MAFNSIIKTNQFRSNLMSQSKICLFISYFIFDSFKLFELRIFLKYKHIYFMRLNTKQINKIFRLVLHYDVVLKNKNIDLNLINLSVLFIDNFFVFIYLYNYLFNFYNNQVIFLYLKINNCFLNTIFFNKFFLKFFIPNFKDLTVNQLKNIVDYNCLFEINNLRFLYFKLIFLNKIFLFFIFIKNFYDKIIGTK